ncbi:hypothetical protein C8A01DRAFT_14300 [Parachaetomium inaequale]|uniref:Secreted protein n=1 Tax=Parachaetomium inaequale TaxID=2588326 RepID=A0AAN6PNE9_9PEZI|nr:hypothetical protein C8A01DRAFT_14300 [Parachaetomium inaequale]
MRASHVLLGLVASAAAIDVEFHSGSDCGGGATICTGLEPNACCTGNSPSVAYRYVPREWTLNAEGYSGGGCYTIVWRTEFRGQDYACMGIASREYYSGSYYWFVNRRRAEEASNRNCTQSVKPDTLLLADGVTKYDIVGLDDAKVEELVAIANTGVGPEGMPEEIQALRK